MTAALQAPPIFALHPSEFEGVVEVHLLEPGLADESARFLFEILLEDWVVMWDDLLTKPDGTQYFEALSRAFVEGPDEDYVLP